MIPVHGVLTTPRLRTFSAGRNDERGSVLFEYSIAFSFLIMATLATVDLGRWLDLHLRVSRLGYEAARYAASVPGLEPGLEGPIHDRVRLRIVEMIRNYGLRDEDVTLTTGHSFEPSPHTEANTVSIRIDAQFSSLAGLPSFCLPSTVWAKIDAPYLYR